MSDYICIKHNSAACDDCVKEMRALEAKLSEAVAEKDQALKTAKEFHDLTKSLGSRCHDLQRRLEEAEKFNGLYGKLHDHAATIAHRQGFWKDEWMGKPTPMIISQILAALEGANARIADAAEMLWVVLANVSGGDWKLQTEEWQKAARRWADNYHNIMTELKFPTAPARDGDAEQKYHYHESKSLRYICEKCNPPREEERP